MAIYAPGKRGRNGKKGAAKRSTVVMLSLTAMVDMFTVLAVFLLQNYRVEEIQLKKSVPLPEATAVKKLKPAHVVVVTTDEIFLDETPVAKFEIVKEQEHWLIQPLKDGLEKAIEEKKTEMESGLKNTLKKAMKGDQEMSEEEREEERAKKYAWGRVTMQADKDIDFLTVKKVMYTITEAGASLINFAVTPKENVPKE
ncbi:MAG: biopolymer transporter ExbD [Bdellovibrionales bacterium]|nr:biopolymer transporter ExbD [Bdellovibrionales bacterium]NQZ19575.1 biopolymer transporter ExbD [Bdellovibrionales bacterium]